MCKLPVYFGEVFIGEVLLEHAEADDLGEEGVRFDVEPRRQQKGKDVRPVGVVVARRHQMLQQRLQLPRHQIIILSIHQFINQFIIHIIFHN